MKLAAFYRRTLSLVLVGGLWSGLVSYWQMRGAPAALSALLIRGTMLAPLPLLVQRRTLTAVVKNPLTWWCVLYVALTALALLIGQQTPAAVTAFRERLVTSVFLVGVVAVAGTVASHRAMGRLLVVVGLLSLIPLLVDIVRPLTFSGVYGRPAGLYVNPNLTAAALLTAMLAGAHAVGRRRELVTVIFALGIVATLSRGGLVALAVVTVLLIASGRTHARSLVLGLLVLAIVVIATGLWRQVVATVSDSPLVAERLRGLVEMGGTYTGGFDDASLRQRGLAASHAWDLFLDHPVLGAGLGATTDWSLGFSTHNIYLRHLAEHGLAGIWIFPLFVLAVARRAPRVLVWPVTAALLVTGLASHNVLDNFPMLILAGWCAGTPEGAREPLS